MLDPAGPADADPLAAEPPLEQALEPAADAALAAEIETPFDDGLAETDVAGDGWSGADIEAAYLKALSAMEDVPVAEAAEGEVNAADPAATAVDQPRAADSSAVQVPDSAQDGASTPAEPVAEGQSPPAAADPAPGPRLARGTDRPTKPEAIEEFSNVSPPQVIEAALFVGGGPLTARKIVGLLRGSFDTASVEQTIEDLNTAYAAQARPYEIRLGEGGYRLELRAEYDRLRHRVYGSGPREVRLAQDVLEVLALVAYRQPISEKEIVSHGKQNAGNLLRQLLRRDLIAFERGPGGRKDLQYYTTPRFLSVFGIATLEDLPQAEDLAKK
ncbi:MAG: SMC-Scp complex subunit ScpB [Planctomycetia bacterium]|nr:SMC-Scp complex subunit ScpB [Planctomycetia bacterium]